MENILEVTNLSKHFPAFSLDQVSFGLPQGHILGLIGPNGAGKTTLIKLLLNVLVPDSGEISIFGKDNIRHEIEVKSRIGFVHDTPNFYGFMKLKEIASIISGFYPKWDWPTFSKLLDRYELDQGAKFQSLSRGTKMKFSLALALSHRAELIVLDEPTMGLDPVFRRDLLAQFSDMLQDGRTSILFSTHITSDLDRTADYIAFIRNGSMELFLPKDELMENWGLVKGNPKLLPKNSQHLFRGIRITEFGFEALTSDIAEIRRRLGDEVLVERPNLEDLMFYMDWRQSDDSPAA